MGEVQERRGKVKSKRPGIRLLPQMPRAPQYEEDWQPPQKEVWTIPPIITDDQTSLGGIDEAIRLRQGIIMEVQLDTEYLFQNVNGNEDDYIDFSLHGLAGGIWGQLNPRSFVRARTTIYFVNRTHKDVLYLASFQQEPKSAIPANP